MSTQDQGTQSEQTPDRRARDLLLASMPLTECRLELAGVSTAVLKGGAGPPMVLLHGHGEFAAVWTRVIPRLVQTHQVIVPDLPGHGESSVIHGTLDTRTVLTWLDELIEATCDAQPVLVGHLMGGAIAARYAVHNSNHLTQLVLVDTLGLSWFRPAPSFAIPMMGFVAHPTPRSRDRLFNKCFLNMNRVGGQAGDQWDPLLHYALDRARTPSVQAALRRLVPRLAVPRIPREDLKQITVPTSLIHGRSDLQVPLRTAQAASADLGWPLHVIDDCRDDPAVEQPEAFLAALHVALAESAEEGDPR